MSEAVQRSTFVDILKRKSEVQESKWILLWAVLNLLLALLLYIDIEQGLVASFFGGSLLWYIEITLGAIFLLNSVVELCLCLRSHICKTPIEVNDKEKRLFRISDSDVGFLSKSSAMMQTSTPVKCSPGECFVLPSALGASSSLASEPILSSWWMFEQGSPNEQGSHKLCRPSFEWNISDPESLDQYMKECSQLEEASLALASSESSWPTHSPRQYQLSTRSPQAPQPHVDDPKATCTADGVWSKWGVEEKQLNQWVENLRKWMSQTILVKLASEMDCINGTLKRLGSSDLQIGEASQATLRQLALTKSQHLPTLGALLPYLDVNINQEYVVQRMKEVARGGCMSAFRWNAGSRYKGKEWGDYLPTDCALVFHILCTYLDSRLPPDPRYPDGKTFSSQFFSKTPDKPAVGKDSLCIHQSCICPPHYSVVIGDHMWDLPQGRNNLFHALLLFLHYIKTKKAGMLGRVNLGPSGINILWVVQ